MPQRRAVILGLAGAGLAAGPVLSAEAGPGGEHDFDFLIGDWRVHHRVLRKTGDWMEFEGTSATRKVLGGFGNLEQNVLSPPSGAYHAVALRAFDPKAGLWSIWWLDGRSPQGPLDPPVRGKFQDGVGSFYSEDVVGGKPQRTRYLWSKITPTSAQWDQATSTDQGAAWETNWVMSFSRVT